MDFLKNLTGDERKQQEPHGLPVATEKGTQSTQSDVSGNGHSGGWMGKVNDALGGGRSGEAKEGM